MISSGGPFVEGAEGVDLLFESLTAAAAAAAAASAIFSMFARSSSSGAITTSLKLDDERGGTVATSFLWVTARSGTEVTGHELAETTVVIAEENEVEHDDDDDDAVDEMMLSCWDAVVAGWTMREELETELFVTNPPLPALLLLLT